MKKKPQRTCIGCNVQKDKNDFIRIVKCKDGNITIDKIGKMSGRGAYICHNVDCLKKAIKSRKIEKVFETNITEKLYNELEEMFKE